MSTQFEPISTPPLDPRNEAQLVELALARVYRESGGRLNDLSPSSPARALIEGQAFAGAELLYWVNQLPDALAIALLKIAGIQRRLGTPAVVTIEFNLTAPLATAFVIPEGFTVKAASNIAFSTDKTLIIPGGNISGTVTATCSIVGTAGNVGAFSITRIVQSLAFLKGCTNPQPATGGTDAETLNQTKARAFASFRQRGLVSQDDYESRAKALLGVGSVAYAIGSLAADRISETIGTVHLFCLNPDGSELNAAQLGAVQGDLARSTSIAIRVYVSNVEVILVDVYVIVGMIPGQNPATTAATIYSELGLYLKPGRSPIGKDVLIKELEYIVRRSGVSYVQSVTIGEHLSSRFSTNLALPHRYSAPRLEGCTIELVDGVSSYVYAYGNGDPD